METASSTYVGEADPSDARRPLIQEILFSLKYYNYNDALWSTVLGEDNGKFQKHLERNYPELLNNLIPYISGENPKLFSDGNGGVLDIAHLAVHQGDDPQLAADAFWGTKPNNFNYADICTDADAIKIATLIKSADDSNPHVFSEILSNYYQHYVADRMTYYLQGMGVSEISVSDIYEYLEKYMSDIPQQAALIFLNSTTISKDIQQACWRAFAKYIYTSMTEN